MNIYRYPSNAKIILPTLLAVLLFVLLLFAYVIPQFENNILERKKEMARELTHSVITVLSYYEAKERQGTLNRQQAQEAAKNIIRTMRYGHEKKDYFWINDMEPVMIMHPYRPDLENKNVADFQEKNGKHLFQEFVAIAENSKSGFAEYMWQWNDDSAKIAPKLSYIQLFEPWQWIVGTGVYTEDVREEINGLSHKITLIAVGVLFIVVLLEYRIVTASIRTEKRRKTAEEELKKHRDHLDILVRQKTEEVVGMNASLRNEIVERKQVESELLQSEERYRDLIDNAHDLIQSIRPDGSFEYVNKAWKETLGYSAEEIASLNVFDLIAPENREHCLTDFQHIMTGEEMHTVEVSYQSKKGELVLLEGNISCRFGEGKPLFTRGIFRDITGRKKAEEKIKEQNDFLHTVIESIPFPFYVINTQDYTITLANSQTAPPHKWQGTKCHMLTHGCETPCSGDEGHKCPLRIVKKTKAPVVVEHVHHDRQGRKTFVEVHGYPIFDKNGEVTQMIEASIDITDKKMLEQKMEEDSITDVLTGLYNRRGFFLLGEKQLKIAKRGSQDFFLMYADLDNLKPINDQLGHQQGDEALREIAQILKNTFRESDIMARIGGDEFVVLMRGGNEMESKENIMQRLGKHIEDSNQRKERRYNLSISMGFAMFDHNAPAELDHMLREADALMYAAKQQKKARPEMKTALNGAE